MKSPPYRLDPDVRSVAGRLQRPAVPQTSAIAPAATVDLEVPKILTISVLDSLVRGIVYPLWDRSEMKSPPYRLDADVRFVAGRLHRPAVPLRASTRRAWLPQPDMKFPAYTTDANTHFIARRSPNRARNRAGGTGPEGIQERALTPVPSPLLGVLQEALPPL